MKLKIKYGSTEEVIKNQLTNPKYFEGGEPMLDISVLAKKMKEYDPDGEKALVLAKKYRRK